MLNPMKRALNLKLKRNCKRRSQAKVIHPQSLTVIKYSFNIYLILNLLRLFICCLIIFNNTYYSMMSKFNPITITIDGNFNQLFQDTCSLLKIGKVIDRLDKNLRFQLTSGQYRRQLQNLLRSISLSYIGQLKLKQGNNDIEKQALSILTQCNIIQSNVVKLQTYQLLKLLRTAKETVKNMYGSSNKLQYLRNSLNFIKQATSKTWKQYQKNMSSSPLQTKDKSLIKQIALICSQSKELKISNNEYQSETKKIAEILDTVRLQGINEKIKNMVQKLPSTNLNSAVKMFFKYLEPFCIFDKRKAQYKYNQKLGKHQEEKIINYKSAEKYPPRQRIGSKNYQSNKIQENAKLQQKLRVAQQELKQNSKLIKANNERIEALLNGRQALIKQLQQQKNLYQQLRSNNQKKIQQLLASKVRLEQQIQKMSGQHQTQSNNLKKVLQTLQENLQNERKIRQSSQSSKKNIQVHDHCLQQVQQKIQKGLKDGFKQMQQLITMKFKNYQNFFDQNKNAQLSSTEHLLGNQQIVQKNRPQLLADSILKILEPQIKPPNQVDKKQQSAHEHTESITIQISQAVYLSEL